MSNLINLKDKFFIAGSKGMVGSAIKRTLIKNGYGNKKDWRRNNDQVEKN